MVLCPKGTTARRFAKNTTEIYPAFFGLKPFSDYFSSTVNDAISNFLIHDEANLSNRKFSQTGACTPYIPALNYLK